VISNIRAHFGLAHMPFGKDLAPGELHQHKSHAEAVARINWCIAEGALGLVTGEVGSGKTVAVRAATSALDPSRHHVIYLGCPAVGARGIYAAIVTALGRKPSFHNASLIPQAQTALAAEVDERGRRVVLVCDEAHLMTTEQLEELRMLTNDNASMDSRSTMACLLIGQPSLRRRVKLGILAALDQRIALRCSIAPMELAETGSYISHHLTQAGRSDRLFSDDAVSLVHQVSRGLPRAVNNLATQALVATYAGDKAIVDEQAARAAAAEIEAE
jgi:type II secretory pathway predicted ATPase ExeA